MSDHRSYTAGGHSARNALGRSEARRQWFLDQKGLTGLACCVHDRGVEHWWDRNDHGLHVGVSDKIAVVIVKGAAIRRSDPRPIGSASLADGDESHVCQIVCDVAGVTSPVLSETDQPDAKHRSSARGARASIE